MRSWLAFASLAGCAEPVAVAPVDASAPVSSAAASAESASAESASAESASGAEREPAAPATSPEPARVPEVVILVPLKSFPAELLDVVEETLRRELHVDVRRHEVVPLPKDAYYQPRRRYRAEILLDHLEGYAEGEPATTRVLGLTEVDISTTKDEFVDWGIFGLGSMPGTAAVVSSFRLRRKADADKLAFRTSIVALHEIGHTFGLDHCSETRCPMQDAEGSIENTDTSSGHLGPECQAELDENRE